MPFAFLVLVLKLTCLFTHGFTLHAGTFHWLLSLSHSLSFVSSEKVLLGMASITSTCYEWASHAILFMWSNEHASNHLTINRRLLLLVLFYHLCPWFARQLLLLLSLSHSLALSPFLYFSLFDHCLWCVWCTLALTFTHAAHTAHETKIAFHFPLNTCCL